MAPMKSKSWCSPGQLVALMLAGWINRHQQAVIAYQREEIKVLREMLGGKCLRFTDQQRRRLALSPIHQNSEVTVANGAVSLGTLWYAIAAAEPLGASCVGLRLEQVE